MEYDVMAGYRVSGQGGDPSCLYADAICNVACFKWEGDGIP